MCMIYLKRIHNYTAPQNNYFDGALYKNFFIKLFINIICGLPFFLAIIVFLSFYKLIVFIRLY